jgi:hypothetical protein
MSIAHSPRRRHESRLRYRLSRQYSWSAPGGWGWEGPEAIGRAFTMRGAVRDYEEACRLIRDGLPIPEKWLPPDLRERLGGER